MCFSSSFLETVDGAGGYQYVVITVPIIKQGWHWKVDTFFSLYMLVQWFFLNVIKHICAKLLSYQHIQEHVCLCPRYMYMSKQGNLLFCILCSCSVSIYLGSIFLFEILLFKSADVSF